VSAIPKARAVEHAHGALPGLMSLPWMRFQRSRSSFSTRNCLAIETSVSPRRIVYCASLVWLSGWPAGNDLTSLQPSSRPGVGLGQCLAAVVPAGSRFRRHRFALGRLRPRGGVLTPLAGWLMPARLRVFAGAATLAASSASTSRDQRLRVPAFTWFGAQLVELFQFGHAHVVAAGDLRQTFALAHAVAASGRDGLHATQCVCCRLPPGRCVGRAVVGLLARSARPPPACSRRSPGWHAAC
jgi:hypothetical protein